MATLRTLPQSKKKPMVGTPAPKAPPRGGLRLPDPLGGGVLRPKMPSPDARKKAKAEMLRRQKAAEARRKAVAAARKKAAAERARKKAGAAARKAKKTTARKTKSPSKSGRG